MYDKYLKELEGWLERLTGIIFSDDEICKHISDIDKLENASKAADLIIKIKTIQALDTSAELIQASRRVSRN